jgi:hypothetical protein
MSFSGHPAYDALRGMGAVGVKPAKPVLDSATPGKPVFDEAAAAEFTVNEIRMAAVAATQEWARTTADALGEGETMIDRFMALMVGVADSNKDGEITPDEEAVITVAMEAAGDFMAKKGVSEEDIAAILNDEGDAAGAADRALDLVKGEGGGDEEAEGDEVDSFTFDAESQASVFDSVVETLDAVYRKKTVIRGGRKVRVNKRVSGTVRLSSAQKVAIRKAVMKSHTAAARVNRMKSVRMRSKMGLK